MSEERSMTTDPTPRTAATARERDIYETVREVIRDYTCLPFGLGEAKEMCSRITSALAAAEAPGRVAALEAALRRIADLDPDLDAEAEAAALASAKRIASNALAAPAPPAGVSGEVCAVCKDVRLGVQHDRYSMSAWHPFRAAPAPTPSEPVGRCVTCGRPLLSNAHEWDHPFTPATRDE